MAGLLPFTDWQNDLHLNIGVAHGLFRFASLDLVILKAAVTCAFLVRHLLAPAKIGAVMFTAAFQTSRHHILLTVMACLCVLLGGPSYAAGADSLFIAGATYYEPGASGPGWAWTIASKMLV